MATMDIKQMLKNGSSPEQLKAALDRQITQAMGEIREEQKAAAITEAKNIEIEETRENLINAALDYFVALGVLEDDEFDSDDLDDLAEGLNEELKKIEKTILATQTMLKNLDYFTKDRNKDNKDSCGSCCPDSIERTQSAPKKYTAADADAVLRSFLDRI